jgi:hypothetical protein
MPATTTPVTAPYAVLESRRSERPALAVVFGAADRPHDELMVIIDPISGQARAQLHRGDFEGHGTGLVTVRRPSHRTCTAVGWLTIRGLDARTEACEALEVSLAVTWSVEPGSTGHHLDVAGTSLLYRLGIDSPTRLGALSDHSFNRFDLTTTEPGQMASTSANVLAA